MFRGADTYGKRDQALAFYRDLLEMEVVYVSLPAFALLRAGSATIGLLSHAAALKDGAVPASAEQRRGVHVEFSTEDLDGLFATLTAKGVSFIQSPHDEPWERSMTALDPDGHSVEFAQGRRGASLAGRSDPETHEKA